MQRLFSEPCEAMGPVILTKEDENNTFYKNGLPFTENENEKVETIRKLTVARDETKLKLKRRRPEQRKWPTRQHMENRQKKQTTDVQTETEQKTKEKQAKTEISNGQTKKKRGERNVK